MSIGTIRVLHVVGQMNCGGTENMIMNFYRNIDRTKVQFDFVVHTDEECFFDKEIAKLGGRIYHCPRFVGKNISRYKKWWNGFFQSDGKDYKIIHGHIGSTAAIYLKIAKKYGKFAIAHSHSTYAKITARSFAYRCLSYNTRNTADYFFACSELAGVSRYGKKTKFKVLPNAIDAAQYSFSEIKQQQMRGSLNIGDELVFGHVGRFNPEKNHPFLIDIFSKIKQIEPTAKLLLVGGGGGQAEIEAKVKGLGLQNDVVFTGVRSDVNDLMQAMDVFVMPSLYEGLPVTMVEAQASGLPCLISERVPIECKKTDLVHQMNLTDGARAWAEKAISLANTPRTDRYEEIKKAGYDIKSAAKWLEEFYIERAK